MDAVKAALHKLANHLQTVFYYVELQQNDRAVEELRRAEKELRHVRKLVEELSKSK